VNKFNNEYNWSQNGVMGTGLTISTDMKPYQ